MSLAASKLLTGLAALLCGALVPLGFAPFGWYPLTLLAIAALAALLLAAKPREALVIGWLFGIGQFSVGVSATQRRKNGVPARRRSLKALSR